MESTRQLKVAKLVQKELAAILLKEGKAIFGSAFITVTTVRMSPDLSYAKIYLSLFGAKDKDQLFALINENKKELRKHLGNRIGKQVRIIPELNFFIDDTLDYAMKIEELIKSTKK